MTYMTNKRSNRNSKKTFKMIAVNEANYNALRRLGHIPESFNDVITKLLKKERVSGMTIMNNNVEPVYSTWPCSKCKPLKTRSIEDSKKADEPLKINMNPISCPYKYIQFLDTGFMQHRIAYGDEQSLGNKNGPPEEIIHCDDWGCDAPGLELTCSHCGVSLGEVHHIRCGKETCPRCKAQLFLCNCCNLGSGNRDKTQLIREGEPTDYIM
jgi:hypothetical protein